MLTVGEILRKTREKKGIKLSQVEKQIKVREKFLAAVENNQWLLSPSKIYIEGIIKNYAKFLGVDPKKILAFFRRDYEKKEEIKFKTKISSKYLTSETKKIILSLAVFVFLIFFGYFSYQLKQYFSPPKLIFISPKTNQFTTEKKIKIIAETDKETMVTIFGERVYPNKDGIFEYDFPLDEGKNKLVIEIVGANGRKSIVTQFYYKKSLQ